MKPALSILTTLTVAASPVQSAILALNFGSNEQSEATAPYFSTQLGQNITSFDYEGGGDWSGNGTTFSAAGATIGIWHDAANTWRNNTQDESSPLHGYLDDGLGSGEQRYIHLTGLSTWLSNVGATSYRITVLRSTDSGTGFGAIDVYTGDVTGETGWLNNSTPTGGSSQFFDDGIAASGVLSASNAEITYETDFFSSDANGVALYYGDYATGPGGRPRGTVAGILIEAVPEPSSMSLLGLGAAGFLLRRRR